MAPNEDYTRNAIHESNEELGITVKEEDLLPYKIFKSDKLTHTEFQHIFALILNKGAEEFHVEKEEINQIKWMDAKEVRKILLDSKIEDWVKKPWDKEILNWLEKLL